MVLQSASASLPGVITAAIASMALGMTWYSQKMLGKKWMKLSGLSKKDMKSMPLSPLQAMGLGLLSNLVLAYVLSLLASALGANTWQAGATLGAWIWLGFVATETLGIVLWQGKPAGLYLLNNAHNALQLALMGAIVAVL